MALGYRVFTEIERPPQALFNRFGNIPTPDLADAMNRTGVVSAGIRPVYQPMPPICGPGVTIGMADGSGLNVLKMGIEMAQAGDVLVIAARGNTQHALLGGNLCVGLKSRGLAGAVVDGAVRDAGQIQSVGFPVHSRGLAINAGPKSGPGEINVPVAFGNAVIFPGDIIVADEEGIVAVPLAHAEAVLQKVEALRATFASLQPTLRRGEVTNIANIRREMEAEGCDFINGAFTRERLS